MFDEYTLPVLHIHAGETNYFRLRLYDNDGVLTLTNNMVCYVYEYCNRGLAVFQMSGAVTHDTDTGSYYFDLVFDGDLSFDMAGKYIYQVTLKEDTDVKVTRKGILYIAFNADGESNE